MKEPLPHNEQAERAVLGSILIASEVSEPVKALLKPDDFYHKGHAAIYAAMLAMDGNPIDPITVADCLEQSQTLALAGGRGYLVGLLGETPTYIHEEHYARIVAERAQERRIIQTAAQMTQTAFKGASTKALELGRELLSRENKRRSPLEVQSSTWADLDAVIGPIRWAWPTWLPKGFLTMVVGGQGTGKSILVLRIAACVLRGDPWPDNSQYEDDTGAVLWCEAEASQAINRERAKAWGLPIERLVSPLADPLADVRLDDLDHKAAIAEIAYRPSIKLIVVDSLSGAHSRDENSSETAKITKWLAELARDTGKPILTTHHLRKRGLLDVGEEINLDRIRGFSGITQTARMVWAADTPDPNKENERRLSVIKSNLARFPEPIGYQIDQGGMKFGDAPEAPRKDTKVDQASELLLALLDKEPMLSLLLQDEARDAGISWRTMDRAKDKLKIVSTRKNGHWYWSLPAREEPNP